MDARTRLRLELSIPPAIALLGSRFDSVSARAQQAAIALQESRVQHRVQIGGPARGWWQFERGGGVHGVLTHQATRPHALALCEALAYQPLEDPVYQALAFADVLAAGFARLLLFSDPAPLPTSLDGPEVAWRYYLRNWRPGKPHRETWDAFWAQGWQYAEAGQPR